MLNLLSRAVSTGGVIWIGFTVAVSDPFCCQEPLSPPLRGTAAALQDTFISFSCSHFLPTSSPFLCLSWRTTSVETLELPPLPSKTLVIVYSCALSGFTIWCCVERLPTWAWVAMTYYVETRLVSLVSLRMQKKDSITYSFPAKKEKKKNLPMPSPLKTFSSPTSSMMNEGTHKSLQGSFLLFIYERRQNSLHLKLYFIFGPLLFYIK